MERDGRADLKSMTLPELTEYLKDLGEKPFRAKQLYQWMHVKLAASLDEMTNLSKEMRDTFSCCRASTRETAFLSLYLEEKKSRI